MPPDLFKVLVLVPFPMSSDQLAKREEQRDEANLPRSVQLHYQTTKAAPSNYVSAMDYVIADIGLLERECRPKRMASTRSALTP